MRRFEAHAYVAANAFSSYTFHLTADDPAAYVDAPHGHADSPTPSGSSPPPQPTADADGELATNPYCQMSVSLSTMLECLNIFGNAGGGGNNPFKKEGTAGYDSDDGGDAGGGANRWRNKRRRQGAGEDEDGADEGRGRFGGGRRGGKAQTADEGKTTSLRLSYAGHGEPLVML